MSNKFEKLTRFGVRHFGEILEEQARGNLGKIIEFLMKFPRLIWEEEEEDYFKKSTWRNWC